MYWIGSSAYLICDVVEWLVITTIFMLRQTRNPEGKLDALAGVANNFYTAGLVFALGCWFTLYMYKSVLNAFSIPLIRRHMDEAGLAYDESVTDADIDKQLLIDVCENNPSDWFG